MGLSCRSVTVLIYPRSVNVALLWDWVFWKRDQEGNVKLTPAGPDRRYTLVYHVLLAFSTSFFTGIFGTSKLSGAKSQGLG